MYLLLQLPHLTLQYVQLQYIAAVFCSKLSLFVIVTNEDPPNAHREEEEEEGRRLSLFVMSQMGRRRLEAVFGRRASDQKTASSSSSFGGGGVKAFSRYSKKLLQNDTPRYSKGPESQKASSRKQQALRSQNSEMARQSQLTLLTYFFSKLSARPLGVERV